MTQTLDVVGTAPVIDTESPTIGSVVDQKKVVELPLNGRNFMELTLLSQGINEGTGTTAKSGFLRKGFAPSAAGMPTTENNYQFDGADNKEGFSTPSMWRLRSMPSRNSRFRSANTPLNLVPVAAQ